jgi:rhomboid protease GluP
MPLRATGAGESMTDRPNAEPDSEGVPRESDPAPPVQILPEVRGPLPPWAAAGPRRVDPRREIYEFRQRLLAATPRVFVTHALVGINVAVLVWMAVHGVSLMRPQAHELLAHGANFGPKTTAGEWWRLATSMFLHVGLIHLLVNMWALWNLGPILERFVGNAGFAILYGLAGLGGGLASVAFNPDVVSAGASGAIFGLMGAIVGFVLPRRDSVPSPVFWGMLYNGGLCIAINLVIGLAFPFIDNAAHLGGLATGFVCGLVLSRPLEPAGARGRWRRNLLLFVIGGAALAGGAVALAQPNLLDEILSIREDYRALLERYDRKQLAAAEFAKAIEEHVVPRWQAARQRVAVRMEFGDLKPDELRDLVTLALAMQFYEAGWEALAAGLREQDPARIDRALRNIRRGDDLL